MACVACGGGCSTDKAEGTGGCSSGGCGTGGCNKLNSYDWLSDMQTDAFHRFPFVEVRFKGGRKEMYRNNLSLELYAGDAVIVEQSSGYHVGFVSLQGEVVRLQMLRKKIRQDDPEIRTIVRKASTQDIEKLQEARNRELPALFRCRQLVQEFKLEMKLSDVEYQADLTKATFYYSSEDRVDFRELIKQLAGEFKVRVDMRQISLRQEAGRIGGIGSCGRELCCSTWLTDFKSVTTSAARYQNLSLNPVKLSGQCGRLKCCLNFELDNYLEAIKLMPSIDKGIETERGMAFLQKTDIFRRIFWLAYKGDNNWIPVPADRAAMLKQLNAQGEKVRALTEEEEIALVEAEVGGPRNVDLTEMDQKFSDRDRAEKRRRELERRKAKSSQKPAAKPQASAGSAAPSPANPQSQKPQQSKQPSRPSATGIPPRQKPDTAGQAAVPQVTVTPFKDTVMDGDLPPLSAGTNKPSSNRNKRRRPKKPNQGGAAPTSQSGGGTED